MPDRISLYAGANPDSPVICFECDTPINKAAGAKVDRLRLGSLTYPVQGLVKDGASPATIPGVLIDPGADPTKPWHFIIPGAGAAAVQFVATLGTEAAGAALLGWFAAQAGATLTINVGRGPFVSFQANAIIAVGIDPFWIANAGVGIVLTLDTLPDVSVPAVAFPRLNCKFPNFSLPSISLPDIPNLLTMLPEVNFGINGANWLTIHWDRLDITATNGPPLAIQKIRFTRLRIGSSLAPDWVIEGDLDLAFNAGELDVSHSSFARKSPGPLATITLTNIYVDANCWIIEWDEPSIDLFIAPLAQHFTVSDPGATSIPAALQILTSPRPEIRLDWQGSASTSVSLPGVEANISVPTGSAPLVWTFLLGAAGGGGMDTAALLITAPQKTNAELDIAFPWLRNDGGQESREIHNDPDHKSLLKVTFTQKSANPVTIALAEIATDGKSAPKFLREVSPQPLLTGGAAPVRPRSPVNLPGGTLSATDWSIDVSPGFKTGDNFILPFLSSAAEELKQLLAVTGITQTLKAGGADLAIDLKLTLGSNPLDLRFAGSFLWDTLSFDIDHDKGIAIYGKVPDPFDLLPGLTWKMEVGPERGAPPAPFSGTGVALLFYIATKDRNYQLRLADGVSILISYTQLTSPDEPISFRCTNFALTPKGINLDAEIVNEPALLNSINTRFTFEHTQLIIRDSSIRDLILHGSGPLPPSLVGEAMVDISVHIQQVASGQFQLASASATVRGSHLLDCRGTRFQFALTGLGLNWVSEAGAYHLYFTLSGYAQVSLSQGDDADGELAWLSRLGSIRIELNQCPLTGIADVIARAGVKFLVPLQNPLSFSFLGAFDMEVRAIGFIPQCDYFDHAGAMEVSGQVKFAQGLGDTVNAKIDFHELFIGLPEPGSFLPRVHFEGLGISLSLGDAFSINGSVEFINDPNEKGFFGHAEITIQGLPTLAVTTSFVRARLDANSPWVRAWFIEIDVKGLSISMPVIPVYLREVGLGFGYRFTLAAIKASDKEESPSKLLALLKELAANQADLARRESWALDIEQANEDPRWTVALRALFSNTSNATSPLNGKASGDKDLPCLFLMDAVIAMRSDLTFFVDGTVHIDTNYYDYAAMTGPRHPLYEGFALLSARKKMFLAHFGSVPGGQIGNNPPLPDIIKQALTSCQYSTTLLMQPDLFHWELGWPNVLRWNAKFGPLEASFRGGTIFRVTPEYLGAGLSFLAEAHFSISVDIGFGIVGVRFSAVANISIGARILALVNFQHVSDSALWAAVGLDFQLSVRLEFWIHIDLFLCSIDLDFTFSLSIGITAYVEFGVMGLDPGLRGSATVSLSVMGWDLCFSVGLGCNTDAIARAQQATDFLTHVGLESTNADPIPGLPSATPAQVPAGPVPAPAQVPAAQGGPVPALVPAGPVPVPAGPAPAPVPGPAPAPAGPTKPVSVDEFISAFPQTSGFTQPGYSLFLKPTADRQRWFFVLFPSAEVFDPASTETRETGFLPPPPAGISTIDFSLTFPDGTNIFHLKPGTDAGDVNDANGPAWTTHSVGAGAATVSIVANWKAPIFSAAREVSSSNQSQWAPQQQESGASSSTPSARQIPLGSYLNAAYVQKFDSTGNPLDYSGKKDQAPALLGDPPLPKGKSATKFDRRVANPTSNSVEAAVQGAAGQFESSPYFRHDRKVDYDRMMADSYDPHDNPFGTGNASKVPQPDATDPNNKLHQAWSMAGNDRSARQVRGKIVHDCIAAVRAFAATGDLNAYKNFSPDLKIPVQLGLIFRCDGPLPDFLKKPGGDVKFTIQQRSGPGTPQQEAPLGKIRFVHCFNIPALRFENAQPYCSNILVKNDAMAIGIAWDLRWGSMPPQACSENQKDVEHSLMHYRVVRRVIYGGPPAEVSFTVKNSSVLHRDGFLAARFKIIEHFDEASALQLPVEGLEYEYLITPVDFEETAGVTATVRAVRKQNTPPLVPTDARLTVVHDGLKTPASLPTTNFLPDVLMPKSIRLSWSPPGKPAKGPDIPTAYYILYFRPIGTVPVGSYGLDASNDDPQLNGLPVTQAAPLPADIEIEITPSQVIKNGSQLEFNNDGPRTLLQLIQDARVLPAKWEPRGWKVFIQAVSPADVRSSLAVVELRLYLSEQEYPPNPRTDSNGVKDDGTRRVSTIEWITEPLLLPPLEPEDMDCYVGLALVPMPPASAWDITGADTALTKVEFRPHPLLVTCQEFRWNQGSLNGNDPAIFELNAGYGLFELDTDAHSRATLTGGTGQRRADYLKTVQIVDLAQPDDLLVIPPDVRALSHWEAWYPSDSARLNAATSSDFGEPPVPGGWYSWKESMLQWPVWKTKPLNPTEPKGQQIPVRDERFNTLHPALADLLKEIENGYGITGKRDSDSDFKLVVQPPIAPSRADVDTAFQGGTPPVDQQAFDKFLDGSPHQGDPYGWAVLQRLGLAVVISIRRKSTGQLVEPKDKALGLPTILKGVKGAIANWRKDNSKFAPYLHVELLVQPAKSIHAQSVRGTPALGAEDLLGYLQISLRPIFQQTRQYQLFNFTVPAADAPASDQKKPIDCTFTATFTGPIADEVAHILDITAVASAAANGSSSGDSADNKPVYPVYTTKYNDATKHYQAEWHTAAKAGSTLRFLARFPFDSQLSIVPTVGTQPTGVPTLPTDTIKGLLNNWTSAFTVDPPYLCFDWKSLYQLVAIYDPTVPQDVTQYTAGLTTADRKNLEEKYRTWAQRFFDHGGLPGSTIPTATGDGPWIAVGYPRGGTPAYATPDAALRITYSHLRQDRWGHNLRYFIAPFSRYDLLWRGLYPHLAGAGRELPFFAPFTQDAGALANGLDVVIDRSYPVDRPAILRSGRIDPAASPAAGGVGAAQPLPPGTTWEVIVAQHPEQRLIEQNQTLLRQTGYRFISHALLRRFIYPSWPTAMKVSPTDATPSCPSIPSAYPATPDIVTSKDPYITGLSQRIGAFSQGAMVLQWRALPFYYEHRLLLTAHTDAQVSRTVSVSQQDFEYTSPDPDSMVEWPAVQTGVVIKSTDATKPSLRYRQIAIRLARYWDCLPASSRAAWDADRPDCKTLRYSALPDPDVRYELVENFAGNSEVQVAIRKTADQANTPPKTTFEWTQLGKRLQVVPAPGGGGANMVNPIGPTGALRQDWHWEVTLLVKSDTSPAPVTAYFSEAYPISDWSPNLLAVDSTQCELRWMGAQGGAKDDLLAALAKLRGDSPFLDAANRIIESIRNNPFTALSIFAVAGPDQIPNALRLSLTLPVTPDGTRYQMLAWQGPATPTRLSQLQAWALVPEFSAVVAKLAAVFTAPNATFKAALDETQYRPRQDELPASLANKLGITDSTISWSEAKFAPNELADLQALASACANSVFKAAVAKLIADVAAKGASSETLGPPIAAPCRASDHPQLSFLTFTPKGGLKTEVACPFMLPDQQFDSFWQFIRQQDPAVPDGTEVLRLALKTMLTSISLSVPIRTTQSQLPDILRDCLLIGTHAVTCKDIMGADEAANLRAVMHTVPDRDAVWRLYETSLGGVNAPDTAWLRMARGSAKPSELVEIRTRPLDHI